jgi:transcriptional regulator with XRE-family HTH domain
MMLRMLRYDARMPPQGRASFGDALRAAIRAAGSSQAELARNLDIDPGQVSRWANGKALPHVHHVRRIEQILRVSLADSFAVSTPDYELFVSAPITGLGPAAVTAHHDAVARVVAAAHQHINGVYWPGEKVRSVDELVAPDLATERNMKVLASCHAYLYLQFADIIHPSGSLVEFGFALGKRLQTTLIIQRDLASPFMLEGFGAVAEGLSFLPKARIYSVTSVDEAVTLVARNGRELLGLA